jgi:uncharacterized membrane protein YfcA
MFTSMLTAALGIGGGSLLLAVMAQILPVKVLIPVHGVVQLGSNVGRTAVLWRHINRELAFAFLIGSVVGAYIGGQIVFNLPVDILRLVLGIFIIYAAWGPKLKGIVKSKIGFGIGGLITTIITMFVGATGPLVIALVKSFTLSPQGIVASTAACLSIQHLLKIIVFGFLGFAFAEYLPLMVCMIASGFIGTLIGRKILLKTNPKIFSLGLNIILTILALRLLWQAVESLL